MKKNTIDWNKRGYSKEQFTKVWYSKNSTAEVCYELGYTRLGTNLRNVLKAAKSLNLTSEHFVREVNFNNFTQDVLREDSSYYNTSKIKNELLKQNVFDNKCDNCGIGIIYNNEPLTLQLDHINGNSRDNRLENLRLLCPNCHSQESTSSRSPILPRLKDNRNYKTSLVDVLVIDSTMKGSSLKIRLLEEKIFQFKCYSCDLSEWNNKEIPLDLEHINGNNKDNRIENITLLCVNCHSQTNTYCGKKNKKNDEKHCTDCKKVILQSSLRCVNCESSRRILSDKGKIIWPDDKKLVQMVNETNYRAVGKALGVSDNAVRKRMRRQNLL